MSPRARLRSRLFLMLFSLALTSVGAEVGLRLIGFRQPSILPPDVRVTYRIEPHGKFHYRGYLPGTFEDFEHLVSFNAHAFHDHDYAVERPATNTYRILVLGDSYVAALSIPLDKTFHKLIEQRLRVEDPLRRGSYEVPALGRGSQAQETELNWLRKYGPEFKPDLVLLVFFSGNDFMENSPLLYARALDFGHFYVSNVVPRKIEFFDRAMIFPSSRLNGLLAETLTSFYSSHLYLFNPTIHKKDLESPELGVYKDPLAPEWEFAFQRTSYFLDHIRSRCDSLHAKFALACLAGPQAVGDVGEEELIAGRASGLDLKRPEHWIESWCIERGVPHYMLSGDLARAGPRKVFWRHDGHLNVFGNQVVADALYPFLVNVMREKVQRSSASPHA